MAPEIADKAFSAISQFIEDTQVICSNCKINRISQSILFFNGRNLSNVTNPQISLYAMK